MHAEVVGASQSASRQPRRWERYLDGRRGGSATVSPSGAREVDCMATSRHSLDTVARRSSWVR